MAPLCFPMLIQINYEVMLRMKWRWLVPNLVPIWSTLLKLQAVKQNGPVFGRPCILRNIHASCCVYSRFIWSRYKDYVQLEDSVKQRNKLYIIITMLMLIAHSTEILYKLICPKTLAHLTWFLAQVFMCYTSFLHRIEHRSTPCKKLACTRLNLTCLSGQLCLSTKFYAHKRSLKFSA